MERRESGRGEPAMFSRAGTRALSSLGRRLYAQRSSSCDTVALQPPLGAASPLALVEGARVLGLLPKCAADVSRRAFSASAVAEASDDGAGGYGMIEPLDPQTRKRGGFPREHTRCGAVAMKCGMTRLWDSNGVGVPLTVLWLDENKVVQVKTEDKEGFYAVQVGAGSRRRKRLNNALVGHFEKHLGKPEVSRKVAEFKVTESCLLQGGDAINADHFVVGQLVDVQGTTRGKGFAGGMKRHGMKGGPASHGTTKAHRTIGSTGECRSTARGLFPFLSRRDNRLTAPRTPPLSLYPSALLVLALLRPVPRPGQGLQGKEDAR